MKPFIGVIHPPCKKYKYNNLPKDRRGYMDIDEDKLMRMQMENVPITYDHSQIMRVNNHFQSNNLEPYPTDIQKALESLDKHIDKPLGTILKKVKGKDGKWYVLGQQKSNAIEYLVNRDDLELSLTHHDNPNTGELYPLDVAFVKKGRRPETKLVQSGNPDSKYFFSTLEQAESYMRNHLQSSIQENCHASTMSDQTPSDVYEITNKLGELIKGLPESQKDEIAKNISDMCEIRDKLEAKNKDLSNKEADLLAKLKMKEAEVKQMSSEVGNAELNYALIKESMDEMYASLNPDAQQLTTVESTLDLMHNPETLHTGINRFAQMCSAYRLSGRRQENEPLAPIVGTTQKRPATEALPTEVLTHKRSFFKAAGYKDVGSMNY